MIFMIFEDLGSLDLHAWSPASLVALLSRPSDQIQVVVVNLWYCSFLPMSSKNDFRPRLAVTQFCLYSTFACCTSCARVGWCAMYV